MLGKVSNLINSRLEEIKILSKVVEQCVQQTFEYLAVLYK